MDLRLTFEALLLVEEEVGLMSLTGGGGVDEHAVRMSNAQKMSAKAVALMRGIKGFW